MSCLPKYFSISETRNLRCLLASTQEALGGVERWELLCHGSLLCREVSATPRDALLSFMTSVECAQKQRAALCRWESGAFCLFEKLYMFTSSSVGGKNSGVPLWIFLVAGPWLPLTWFNWGFCQAYYLGCSLAALSKQHRLMTNYHLHMHRMKHINSSLKKNNFLFNGM